MAKSEKRAQRTAEPQRQPALPGAEQVRIGELDRLCEDIGPIIDDRATLRQNLEHTRSAAIKALQRHGLTSYQHQGVQVLLVPGDAKLSIRRNRQGGENADADEVGDV